MHQPLAHRSLGVSAAGAEELYAKLTIAAGVFFVVLEISYFTASGLHFFCPLPLDGFGPAIGRDFVNTWMGGRSAFSGGPAPWFDFDAYNAALRQMTGN